MTWVEDVLCVHQQWMYFWTSDADLKAEHRIERGTMSKTYEQLIPRSERDNFEKALNMESGYVLIFTEN